MKHLYTFLCVLFTTFVSCAAQSPFETRVLAELNLARASPAAYAAILADYRLLVPSARPGVIRIPGFPTTYSEGRPAIDEAIAFLLAQKPLPPLSFSPSLTRASTFLLVSQQRTNTRGHNSPDGTPFRKRLESFGSWSGYLGECLHYGASTPREAVIDLIVEDGIPDRYHRLTIFTPELRIVGISFGPHPSYGSALVMDFAGTFVLTKK